VADCDVGLFQTAGDAVFQSTILWGNTVGLDVYAGTSAFTWSDVQGPEVISGEGNVRADPGFVDPRLLDFHLRPGSPCLGSGAGGTDMGAYGVGVERSFLRGDADDSGVVNLADAIAVLSYLFGDAPPITCADALDANDNGVVSVADPIFLLGFLFRGGPPPAPPFPAAGRDPTADDLGCW
jgi:hypothetical protein